MTLDPRATPFRTVASSLLCAAAFLLAASPVSADDFPFTYPSNTGLTGLMETPTAQVMQENRYRIGASVVDPHRENPDYAGGVWAIVPVDLAKLSGRARRINITLPERARKEVDSCAKAIGETRSGFLLRAALEYIARHRVE